MDIVVKTKYDIGQTIYHYYINNNNKNIVKDKISNIEVYINDKSIDVYYVTEQSFILKENQLFSNEFEISKI
ncbi:hypothetical protein [uncultured Methanobrevibacter sp.]|uniref:hypothetical protein n=1 Tax=uncultured Methanobrevibacter sp. TaxID=253161 RepID=UPI0025F41063|nr:hypothetical protein [uncultured Methanobrevibacter sp.]